MAIIADVPWVCGVSTGVTKGSLAREKLETQNRAVGPRTTANLDHQVHEFCLMCPPCQCMHNFGLELNVITEIVPIDLKMFFECPA